MWIFGYGSLVWKADFPYIKKVVGYVKGYERKFWQASIDHRGVPGKPGRVVTLVSAADPDAKVWGAAYKIHRNKIAYVIRHLDLREVMGYEKVPVEFHPIPNHPMNFFDVLNSSSSETESRSHLDHLNFSEGSDSGCSDISDSDDEFHIRGGHPLPIQVTMYFGSESNEHFVGPAPLDNIAVQIFECTGSSGTNRDYLYNLAKAMREICEEALDAHLRDLERAVKVLEEIRNE